MHNIRYALNGAGMIHAKLIIVVASGLGFGSGSDRKDTDCLCDILCARKCWK